MVTIPVIIRDYRLPFALVIIVLTSLIGAPVMLAGLIQYDYWYGILEWSERINIILTVAIIVFAWIQISLDRKRSRIETLRDELEKAYGSLFSMFITLKRAKMRDFYHDLDMLIDHHDKQNLDKIMIQYPYMFDVELWEFWNDEIKTARPYSSSINSVTAATENWYFISGIFIEGVFEGYKLRKNEYYRLTGI